MAQKDSRRLSRVLNYLYPDLNKKTNSDGETYETYNPELRDYIIQDDQNGEGSFLIWQNTEIPEPTEQELADAKEPAINAAWWFQLRRIRDARLRESDWTQTPDVPSAVRDAWITYRQELRDLPATVTKPDYETLNNERVRLWLEHILTLMPTEPTE